eukprot:scaffold4357_cov80-Skeletonema_marinoi.AAC.2
MANARAVEEVFSVYDGQHAAGLLFVIVLGHSNPCEAKMKMRPHKYAAFQFRSSDMRCKKTIM